MRVQYLVVFALLAVVVVAVVRYIVRVSRNRGGCPNCTGGENCPYCAEKKAKKVADKVAQEK